MYGYQCGKETRTKMNMVHFPDRYLCLNKWLGKIVERRTGRTPARGWSLS